MARTPSLEARSKILDAAEQVVRDEGVDGFTVDEVARRSGVAKTTIYRHFDSAHHLIVEALSCMILPIATPNTGSLRKDLMILFGERLPLVTDQGMRSMILGLLDASARDPELQAVLDAMHEQRLTPVRTVVELAQARGEVRADVGVDDAVDLIHGAVFMRTIVRQLPLSVADLERLIDLSVRALEGP